MRSCTPASSDDVTTYEIYNAVKTLTVALLLSRCRSHYVLMKNCTIVICNNNVARRHVSILRGYHVAAVQLSHYLLDNFVTHK